MTLPDSPLALTFKEASHYLHTNRTDDEISLFVVHTAECAVTNVSAESLQNYASLKTTGVSWHYSIDTDSVEQSVPEAAIAYAAGHDGNLRGIHTELAGRAAQTATDWASPDNLKVLRLLAELMADVCARRGIPIEFVDHAQILAGARGVTTHREVALAWPAETNHTDPGPAFPMADLLALARTLSPTTTDPPDTLPSATDSVPPACPSAAAAEPNGS